MNYHTPPTNHKSSQVGSAAFYVGCLMVVLCLLSCRSSKSPSMYDEKFVENELLKFARDMPDTAKEHDFPDQFIEDHQSLMGDGNSYTYSYQSYSKNDRYLVKWGCPKNPDGLTVFIKLSRIRDGEYHLEYVRHTVNLVKDQE